MLFPPPRSHEAEAGGLAWAGSEQAEGKNQTGEQGESFLH